MSGLSALFPVQIDFGISGFRVRDKGIGQHYDALAVCPSPPQSFLLLFASSLLPSLTYC